MTARRILGIDPGDRIGWALLEEVQGGLPRVLGSGAWDLAPPEGSHPTWRDPAAGLPCPFRAGDVVAIERPDKPHPASLAGGPGKVTGIVKGLLLAAWVGGELAGRARGAGAVVLEVSASEARRAAGVVIGGSRKGPPCETCSGSGAGDDLQPGSQLTPEAALQEVVRLRKRAGEILQENARRARGKKARLKELAGIRLRACAVFPCSVCRGAGERRPPSVDQQVAALLPGLVAGWPDRSNVHERDAAVVALHGFRNGGRHE